jgi:pimeloyl-ACP methyl ester carboxylesterase
MNPNEFDGLLPPWALLACGAIGDLYDDRLDDSSRFTLGELCGRPAEFTLRPIESGVPSCMRVVGTTGMAVVITGLSLPSQAQLLLDSYRATLIASDTNFFPQWIWAAATQISRNLRLDQHSAMRDVFLFGHSAGGVIALALASLLHRRSSGLKTHVVTYGAPRSFAERGNLTIDGVQLTRWMNTGDDVPRLPPRYYDLTDLTFLGLLAEIPLYARWIHPRGGVALDPAGNRTTAQVAPAAALLSLPLYPLGYLRTGAVFGTAHSIGEYARRLRLAIPSKIFVFDPKIHGAFGLGALPQLFQALEEAAPLAFPVPPRAGTENPLANPPLELAVQQRTAFIAAPLKRC